MNKEWVEIILGMLFVSYPSALLVRKLMWRWSQEIKQHANESLHQAGTYIGILERLFVYVFIIKGHWEVVGFLLTAKSIFRFGDLSNAKDRKLTEYILIGTMLSFGLATFAGLLITN
ncbi:hypothetical protein U0R10_01855 [Aquirufa sp. OSTEICH-129V]|uniref:DUF3307 domain-containing protein n=1 Tax=Aquirufa avitistagni TaxID=3104728 RepID=A0ABW6D9A7_9BACT